MPKLVKDKYDDSRHVMVDDVFLCGAELNDNSAFPTDVATVVGLKDRQEPNWSLCPVCASKFTGLPETEFVK